MHIPDGYLSARTAAAAALLAGGGLALALRRVRAELPPRRVPLLGLSAAFVFAAQMINFPVAAGTSGHLVGGVLAGVLLGPSAAVVVLSAVLIVLSACSSPTAGCSRWARTCSTWRWSAARAGSRCSAWRARSCPARAG